MKCSKEVIGLEKLARERRRLGSILLNLDMYERWGQGADEKMNKEMQKLSQYNSESEETKKKIGELLNEYSDEVLAEWADAHIALLNDFIKKMKIEEKKYSTEIYVAKEEKKEWRKLKKRKITYVQQNVYYIYYDNEMYKEYFGFEFY